MSSLLDTPTKRPGDRPAPTLNPDLARRLTLVAFRPAVVALTAIAAIIIITLVAANSDLTGMAGAVAASWLGIHQVPQTIGSAAIGVLPLLPTVVLLWMVARSCAKVVDDKTTRRELAYVVGAAVGGPFLVTAVCLAVIKDASEVLVLAPPNTLAAFGWTIFVHLVGAAIGIATQLWRQIVLRADVPGWVLAGLIAGVQAGRRLLIAATTVTLLCLVASWPTVGALYENSDGFTGVLGLTALSLLYLPNVIVGTMAVLTGATAGIGEASISLFGVIGGPVPGLPVMAVVPTGQPHGWWLGLLAIPVYVGVRLGRDCAASGTDRWSAAKSAAAGAAAVGLVAGVVAATAGGTLGTFGHVGAVASMFGVLSFGWLALLGSTTALITGRPGVPRPDKADTTDDEPEEERVVAALPAVDAEIVDEPIALEAAGATVLPNEQLDAIDAEVVDLPESGQ